MAADLFPKLKELTLKNPDKGILSFKANGVIKMWSPVIIVAPAAGEKLPRVGTTTIADDPLVIGIAAGGSGDVANGNAADDDTDIVDVIPISSAAITKVRISGAFALGEHVSSGDTPTQADQAPLTSPSHPIGKLLQVGANAGDVVLIFMGGSI